MIDQAELKKLLNLMKREANYVYVFRNLSSPEWIEPLRKKGFFQDPPAPIREGNGVRFPSWPESYYLLRMADQVPELVRDVALKVPETSNVRVHIDLAEAGLKMPPKVAKSLVKPAKQWLKNPHLLNLPESLGKLVAHLAKGGETKSAADLARTLLAPHKQGDEEITGRGYMGPDVGFEIWEYDRILSEYVSELIKVDSVATFTWLAALLDRSVELSVENRHSEKPEDGSYIWRELIDRLAKDSHHMDVRSSLVGTMSRATETAAGADDANVDKLLAVLDKYEWNIFVRFRLHLLRLYPAGRGDRIREALLSRDLLNETGVRNEYSQLLKDSFKLLTPDKQKQWLDLVDAGPLPRPSGEPYEADYIPHWKRLRLAPVADQLPEEWKKKHAEIVKDLDVPKDFRPYTMEGTSWTGPTSPKSLYDLDQMSPAEVIEWLRQWKPKEGFREHSPEGLGRIFSEDVAKRSMEYSKVTAQLKGLEPTYVRNFFWGLRQAVDKGWLFSWPEVMDLAEWVIQQADDSWERTVEGSDPDWGWTRKSVADLLYAAMQAKAGKAELPISERGRAWKVIEPLTNDPDPTPEYEKEYRGKDRDSEFDNLSINTVRGEAMHAVMFYVTWVQRHLEKTKGKDKYKRSMDDVPEAKAVLEKRLSLKLDPSMTTRAVYGQWSPWLQLADPAWFKKNELAIYPHDSKLSDYWWVAWLAHVTLNRPYTDVFKALRKQYLHSIEPERLKEMPQEGARRYRQSLAVHLMHAYWHGELKLGDKDKLLEIFFANAPVQMRAEAIDHLGDILGAYPKKPSKERMGWLKELWEWRLAECLRDSEANAAELAAFGAWFVGGITEKDWLEQNLLKVLQTTGRVEPEYKVVERLKDTATRNPELAIQCLDLMVENPKNYWAVDFWREDASEVLRTALKSGNDKAVSAATDLIHKLGAKGYQQFGDLLKS